MTKSRAVFWIFRRSLLASAAALTSSVLCTILKEQPFTLSAAKRHSSQWDPWRLLKRLEHFLHLSFTPMQSRAFGSVALQRALGRDELAQFEP